MSSPDEARPTEARSGLLIARFDGIPIVVDPSADRNPAVAARGTQRVSPGGDAVRLGGPGAFRVVVQKGRSFQRANPHVPVIVDRGRYLVVELPPDIQIREESSFAIAAAEGEPVAFEVHRAAPAVRRAELDAAIARITSADLRERVEALAVLHTRHSLLPRIEPAVVLTSGWLRDAGCEVERVEFPIPGGRTANVIGTRAGSGDDRRLFVLCAHLDSVNHDAGPDARAPGADDNASGSATIAAIAAAVAPETLRHDVHFILFGGEEQGLFGSKHYVSKLSSADRARIAGVVNIDMAAMRNTQDPTVLLEGADVSRDLIAALAQAAATYTTLATQVSLQPFASDHVPFINGGMPAVLTIEGTDDANVHEHTDQDTPDRLDFELHREITTMNLAWLLEHAR